MFLKIFLSNACNIITFCLQVYDALISLYPKMQTVTGGWLLYKSSGRVLRVNVVSFYMCNVNVQVKKLQTFLLLITGGWGSRKLSYVSPDDAGYTGKLLKSVAQGGKKLFIVPVQDNLSTSPLKLNDEAFNGMAKAKCQKCRVDVPLQLLQDHINSCSVIEIDCDLPDEVSSHLIEEEGSSFLPI